VAKKDEEDTDDQDDGAEDAPPESILRHFPRRGPPSAAELPAPRRPGARRRDPERAEQESAREMNDVEKWVNLEGPEPEAVRAVFDPLRAAMPSREEMESMERAILQAVDRSETGAPTDAELPLSFEAWAELSASLIGAGPEERLDVLDARDIRLDDWRRCEAHYFASLTDDLVAQRVTRTLLYARLCREAVTRRKALPEAPAELPPAEVAPAEVAAAPPPPPLVAAPPVEVATFQKMEQAAAAPPPVAPAYPSLTGTAPPYAVPSGLQAAVLPFVPAPPAPPPPPPGTAGTLKLPAAHEGMGGTLPLGADLSAYVRDALPFVEQTAAGGTVPFPKLAVNQYATFCAKVADASPEEVEKIQEEFEVRGRLAREALDSHWRHVFATNPTLRAAFEGMFPVYLAYARSLRK
jgi:hypothetical protein